MNHRGTTSVEKNHYLFISYQTQTLRPFRVTAESRAFLLKHSEGLS
jgi:hypothetical protein